MTETVGRMLGATLLILAAGWDLSTRRIPNVLCLAGACCGLLYSAWRLGGRGVLYALAGSGLVLLCSLLFYLTGALGAGDCKLAAVLFPFYACSDLLVLYASALLLGAALGVAALLGRLSGANRSKLFELKVPFACCMAAGAAAVEVLRRMG